MRDQCTFSKAEDRQLTELWPTTSNAAVATIMHRSEASVRRRAQRLGLRRPVRGGSVNPPRQKQKRLSGGKRKMLARERPQPAEPFALITRRGDCSLRAVNSVFALARMIGEASYA